MYRCRSGSASELHWRRNANSAMYGKIVRGDDQRLERPVTLLERGIRLLAGDRNKPVLQRSDGRRRRRGPHGLGAERPWRTGLRQQRRRACAESAFSRYRRPTLTRPGIHAARNRRRSVDSCCSAARLVCSASTWSVMSRLSSSTSHLPSTCANKREPAGRREFVCRRARCAATRQPRRRNAQASPRARRYRRRRVRY